MGTEHIRDNNGSNTLDMDVLTIPGGGGFQFSAVKPAILADLASEYTLVTLAIDVTGSVYYFADQLLEMVKYVVRACKKSPRSENLLLRVIVFNTKIKELHGFIPVGQIDPDNDYKPFSCTGLTALRDAIYSGIGATLTLAQSLTKKDFTVNGVLYVITDGDDNASSRTPTQIADMVDQLASSEGIIESFISILVGINTKQCSGFLYSLQNEAKLTKYIDAGDATPQNLAKLGGWVSKSVSSVSQSLGTGGPSQPLSF
jgi:uncharacterized protein YegL